MDLAERLRHALASLELSQAELARRSGISRGTVNKIVNAKREPNAAQLGLLAHVLGLELDELIGEEQQEEERLLMESQLRQAVLRIQRGERARAEQAAASQLREVELAAELERLRETLERERATRTREREELCITAREAQAKAQVQALRLLETEHEIIELRQQVARLRANNASPTAQAREPDSHPNEPLSGLEPLGDPRMGSGFTELVLTLALHTGTRR